jgi:hypothetical protein
MTQNKAEITYTINVENLVTFTKKQTFSKSIQGLKGLDGADGADGTDGVNGLPAYIHYAYASSADGQTGFSTT